ncbi:unnamed protein product [Danaus chrysippus]|uniref:(African queen) hypothetical protein n=1 Tax=Danaus chrysippus TaxID=151541 RepID=A0A8J2R2B8_9NEOP|nr:unnamed protein product [Danaus chrysippus]
MRTLCSILLSRFSQLRETLIVPGSVRCQSGVKSRESGGGVMDGGRRCVLVFICLFAVKLLWFTPLAVGGRSRVTRDLKQQGLISIIKKNIQTR